MTSSIPLTDVDAVRELYDRIAAEYDGRYRDPYSRIYDDVTWHHLGTLLDRLPRDAPVLDVAAGTGYVTLELLRRGFTDITAVDLSSSMLTELEQHGAAFPRSRERLTFQVEDFHDLSALPREHFAAVFCQGSALSCTSRPRVAAREMRRRLAPGGWLNLSVHNRWGCVEKILELGRAEDLRPALDEGLWHWYENGERIHEMYLFTDEDLENLAVELGLTLERRIGKLVLSRPFVEALEPGTDRYRTARRFAIDHAADVRLRRTSEYTDVVLRASRGRRSS